MHDELTAAIETLEDALAHAAPLSDSSDLEPVRQLIDDIRLRRGFLGKTLVVAIAGGTGTGKSSLLNALSGKEISPVGPIRPTTDFPVAWIPPHPTSELMALLAELGVERQVSQAGPSYLAILDLPDFDSIVADHHDLVDVLVSRVDVVIWVADPEKYNDRVLHKEFIEAYLRYQDQFLFVLNQIDLVSDPRAVARDWEDRLRADGAVQPFIYRTAADPAVGTPIGIEDLRAGIKRHLDSKRATTTKFAADMLRAADLLAEASGVGAGTDLSFETRWATARRQAAAALAPPSKSPGEAARIISDFVDRLAYDSGWQLGRQLREMFAPSRISVACESAATRMASPDAQKQQPRRSLLLGGAAVAALALLFLASGRSSGAAVLIIVLLGGVLLVQRRQEPRPDSASPRAIAEEALEEELGTDLRRVLRPRGELGALLAQLGIEAARLGTA